MNSEQFHNESMNDPCHDAKRAFFSQLGVEYHHACEAYDRTVCGALRSGVAIPVSALEQRLIQANARAVRGRLIDRAMLRYPGQDVGGILQEAIRDLQGAGVLASGG